MARPFARILLHSASAGIFQVVIVLGFYELYMDRTQKRQILIATLTTIAVITTKLLLIDKHYLDSRVKEALRV
jgi:hypothetical protein